MERLKIAIAGGGIASLCLAHALTHRREEDQTAAQWDVKIFEASPHLRDEGAAIGLGTNAQEALEMMGLREVLDEAGGVPCDPAVRIMMGTGPNSGMHIGDVPQPTPQITVHRTAFWSALLRRIPTDTIRWDKRLASIVVNPEDTHPITLTFTDSSTYSADALVGCDGINSIVRQHILGADHPAAKPFYTNGYSHRVVVPMAEAEEAFGREYCALRTQTGWVGQGGFLLTDHNDNGASMQVIAGWSDKGPWPYEAPFVAWEKERLKRDLEGWGEIGEAMLKIFLAQPTLHAAAGRIHRPTPTYTHGPLCLAGDAAQTFPPAQGAGTGQAIEDALILSTVLLNTPTPSRIPLAFQIYDALRHPRRSAIAESSIWAGKFLTGRDPEVGVDVERIRATLPVFQTTVFGVDLEGLRREAVGRMGLGRGGGGIG